MKLENGNGDIKQNALGKIGLPTSEGVTFVNVSDIIRCEASGNYTDFLFSNGKKILVSRTLKEFEELLIDSDFCRVHNSHLINMNHLLRYVRGKGGYVIMTDGTMVNVSIRKKEIFMRSVADFMP